MPRGRRSATAAENTMRRLRPVTTVHTSRARRLDAEPSPRRSREAASQQARRQRRERQRHFARRRRDLLQDTLVGLLLAVVILSVTAGLAVVALIELAVGMTVGTIAAVRRVR